MSDAAKPAAWTAAPPATVPGALRRYGVWIAAAAILVVLPHIFSSGTAMTVMSLMGIAVIFALSYNMLLGQTGMLSFGHAVYYGLGAFCAVHVMNLAIRQIVPVPLVLIPLIGGLGGLLFGVIFGSVSTRRARHRLRHDLAGPGRAGRVERAHFARLLRRRGRRHDQSDQAAAPVRLEFRAADPGLLPDRRLVPGLHDRHVRADTHAVRPHVQRRARQSRARAIRRLQPADRALHRVQHLGLLRRHRGRTRRHQFRDRQFELCRPGPLGHGPDRGLSRRRRLFRRPDHRRGRRDLSADSC